MNIKQPYFDTDEYAAWTPGFDCLAIGKRGAHWNDSEVSLFRGQAAEEWERRAIAEDSKTKLTEDGFFPW